MDHDGGFFIFFRRGKEGEGGGGLSIIFSEEIVKPTDEMKWLMKRGKKHKRKPNDRNPAKRRTTKNVWKG